MFREASMLFLRQLLLALSQISSGRCGIPCVPSLQDLSSPEALLFRVPRYGLRFGSERAYRGAFYGLREHFTVDLNFRGLTSRHMKPAKENAGIRSTNLGTNACSRFCKKKKVVLRDQAGKRKTRVRISPIDYRFDYRLKFTDYSAVGKSRSLLESTEYVDTCTFYGS